MRISTCRICKTVAVIALFSLTFSLLSIFNFEHGTKQDTNSIQLALYKRNYGRQLSVESDKQVVVESVKFHRKTNGVADFGQVLKTQNKHVNRGSVTVGRSLVRNENSDQNVMRKTVQSDIFISVKTTKSNRMNRLQLLMDTWISLAGDETYIFTDNDKNVPENFPSDHFVNTDCANSHYRKGLCCKMGREYDVFMEMKKRWFCHVDDDNYVNMPALTRFLQGYSHTEDWYLGRPSISHPIEVLDRANPGQRLAFWFATGGAGFCISRNLAEKMLPYAGGGRITTAGDAIRLPDDCTIGYIINYLLKVPLTSINGFHSHLEGLHRIPISQLSQQLTFSYSNSNVINIQGYSLEKDPTRFKTIHCYLYPSLDQCVDLPR